MSQVTAKRLGHPLQWIPAICLYWALSASCSWIVSPSDYEDAPRDRLKQPYASNAIWNLPLGRDARMVPAGLPKLTWRVEPAVLVLTPSAPLTKVRENTFGAWTGRSRCGTDGPVLFEAPIPTDFVVPGEGRDALFSMPAAILLADGATVKQTTPLARCAPGADATSFSDHGDSGLAGEGLLAGSHGNSGLSAIGGTVRLGEWLPGERMRHALKVALPSDLLAPTAPGFRWPARYADSRWQETYRGGSAPLVPAALLTLAADFEIDGPQGLSTEAARALAWTLQHYGAYVVALGPEGTISLFVELGPGGDARAEFAETYGFPLSPAAGLWSADLDRIVGALRVVENWDEATYQRVSRSEGAEGAGGGAPLVRWAPELDR